MRGFTLIELLIVMLIGSVILNFVGAVGFHQYQRTQQLKEREQFYRILEHTQFEALLARSPLQLQLNDNSVELIRHNSRKLWQFQYLKFEGQQLHINGNGFWLPQEVMWREHDQYWRLPLNPLAIQNQVLISRPAAERLSAKDGSGK